jgi:hypothetical protein
MNLNSLKPTVKLVITDNIHPTSCYPDQKKENLTVTIQLNRNYFEKHQKKFQYGVHDRHRAASSFLREVWEDGVETCSSLETLALLRIHMGM